MTITKISEGELDFAVPTINKPIKTWYRVYGDLSSGERPLIALHGGPGAPHQYLLPIAKLAKSSGRPIIFYDQIGCGKSTPVREKRLVGDFWTDQLFLDELDNLLTQLGVQDDYDILGHSWGAMLGAMHAIRQPKGLRKLILSDGLAHMKQWISETRRLVAGLPQDVQDTIEKHERDGTTDSEEYEEAVGVFYAKHLCRLDPMPELLVESLSALKVDDTVYRTMSEHYEHFEE